MVFWFKHLYSEIYKRFQNFFFFFYGIALIWREVAHNDTIHTFEVMMEENSSRLWTVQFNTSIMEIHCTCKKFEFLSYLCSHVFKIPSIKISRIFLKNTSQRDGVKMLRKRCVFIMLVCSYNSIIPRLKLYFVIIWVDLLMTLL